ncbi:hypothetical protein [Flavobacterium aquatile]|uniref:Uncharacterized protein n=1 Tax=Flavobacterium aquatile LMG 4008 = ATCC 11947 TaxID=1453498 RepID=A0A095V3D9_9FLAO|nr:hypothetical protein [Flavobacterium aquatile]KGD69375.1 hypothetical protein LG45_00965 [Flavobacterium aquatile LMG 4008 = ATCC 11947]OXA66169.1 hypothetical protein B0A61_12925 [Flavobacterium aquatile LMG 4008 = ATCC 11947]GEC77659.1 hypothetical protein FAQ01_05290 [Flavobacterium aquatile]
MKTYLFSDEELFHLKYIKDNSPIRIWFENICYVFEYGSFHFLLEIKLAEKINLSQSSKSKEEDTIQTQYAMKTQIIFKDEKFVAQSGSELLVENEEISEIEMVKTKLYFTEVREIKKNLFESESSQINPTEDLPTEINIKIEKVIMADVGIIVKFESKKILNLFINENEDDFQSTNLLYQEGNFYAELKSKYQFIALS